MKKKYAKMFNSKHCWFQSQSGERKIGKDENISSLLVKYLISFIPRTLLVAYISFMAILSRNVDEF